MIMTGKEVVDLILDMNDGNASIEEMARVIDFSRVVINAERDIKNYYGECDIDELVEKYGRKK